ncbi:putative bifunctional diguanylate cyclase/phosphodiesterase [Kineococcus sp. SYSU DK004]|uniref:putative bifunctional diguanylate cyclase/phosphodiesterase n=1 Tax=Kineococcus sp. SYSU DK004 TaxID=3383125 RepID=UPI003D7EA8CC
MLLLPAHPSLPPPAGVDLGCLLLLLALGAAAGVLLSGAAVAAVVLLRRARPGRSRGAGGTRDGGAVDRLTGLPTGSAFAAAVATALAEDAAEPGRPEGTGGTEVAVVHLALDGFREVNLAHGRPAGDAVLTEVARRLRAGVRGGDVTARLGGDEFAVLLHDAEGADRAATRLLELLAAPVVLAGPGAGPAAAVALTASAGVATGGRPARELLAAAERALRAAKDAGGGCARRWDAAAERERAAEGAAAERLRRGIDDGELEVHYQPCVDVDSRVVSGVECLVRWRRDGELVPPDAFVGLAERHGLVADLGREVLAQAVRDAPLLAAAAGHDVVVAVNVSAPQLRDPALVPAVRRAVADLAPRRLVLEMTESVLVAEDDHTTAVLEALVEAGAHLCVDDFGTGYATLAYLRRRPFTAFKVDRSYVREIETDARTRALVEGLVLLAAATGMGLVAEGVETPEQARLLHGMGAPTQQGFLHARPEPLAGALWTIRRLTRELREAPVPVA